jgi:hypothetical protein
MAATLDAVLGIDVQELDAEHGVALDGSAAVGASNVTMAVVDPPGEAPVPLQAPVSLR